MGNADGEVNNFISSLMQAEWPSQQQERKKTDTNERSENQVSTKEKKIRAQIDKRPKRRRRDENVGDGKLKTNKENALAFIRYSVDVC